MQWDADSLGEIVCLYYGAYCRSLDPDNNFHFAVVSFTLSLLLLPAKCPAVLKLAQIIYTIDMPCVLDPRRVLEIEQQSDLNKHDRQIHN